jgi:hypothetical protein
MQAYLDSKLNKQIFLMSFIEDAATAGYSREATTMLSGSTAPRMTHILKSIPKTEDTSAWMIATDEAHISTWLRCLTNSIKLEEALSREERELLTETLDIPPQLGGAGLQSLALSADEEFLGSWAAILAPLSEFFRATGEPIYEDLANVLDSMAEDPALSDPTATEIPAIAAVRSISNRAHSSLADITEAELDLATSLSRGHCTVEVASR